MLLRRGSLRLRTVCAVLAKLVAPLLALCARWLPPCREIWSPRRLVACRVDCRVDCRRVPVLLIHGEEDRCVPCEMSRRIAAANPEKIRLEMFPGAGHGLSYLIDKPRYTKLVMDFTARVLAGAESRQQ